MYVPCVYDIRYISGNYGRPGKDTDHPTFQLDIPRNQGLTVTMEICRWLLFGMLPRALIGVKIAVHPQFSAASAPNI